MLSFDNVAIVDTTKRVGDLVPPRGAPMPTT